VFRLPRGKAPTYRNVLRQQLLAVGLGQRDGELDVLAAGLLAEMAVADSRMASGVGVYIPWVRKGCLSAEKRNAQGLARKPSKLATRSRVAELTGGPLQARAPEATPRSTTTADWIENWTMFAVLSLLAVYA